MSRSLWEFRERIRALSDERSGEVPVMEEVHRYANGHLVHLSPDCKKLLKKAGNLVEVSVIEDPQYGVAVDYGAHFDDELPK